MTEAEPTGGQSFSMMWDAENRGTFIHQLLGALSGLRGVVGVTKSLIKVTGLV